MERFRPTVGMTNPLPPHRIQPPYNPPSQSPPHLPSSFSISTSSALAMTSTLPSNPQPSFSTCASSPPTVPQSANLQFIPSGFHQCSPEHCCFAHSSTDSSFAPSTSQQAALQSVHNSEPECPSSTSSCLALERGDAIQKSYPASENPEATDFIHRWIRSLRSDLSPYTLSPRSPVNCGLEDEAAFPEDSYPDQISEGGHPSH